MMTSPSVQWTPRWILVQCITQSIVQYKTVRYRTEKYSTSYCQQGNASINTQCCSTIPYLTVSKLFPFFIFCNIIRLTWTIAIVINLHIWIPVYCNIVYIYCNWPIPGLQLVESHYTSWCSLKWTEVFLSISILAATLCTHVVI